MGLLSIDGKEEEHLFHVIIPYGEADSSESTNTIVNDSVTESTESTSVAPPASAPADSTEPVESFSPMESTLPVESIEPTESTEGIESIEPIESTESTATEPVQQDTAQNSNADTVNPDEIAE